MIIDKTLIARFFKGDCTEEEAHQAMEWMHSHASDDFFAREIEQHWSASENCGETGKDIRLEFIKKPLLHKIRSERGACKARERTISNSYLFAWRWIAAAVVFLLLAFGLYHFSTPETDTPVVAQVPSTVVKQNPPGQKTRTFLPDGSIVWLNAESRLLFPEQFAGAVRQVELSGEAYFEVVRDPAKPFVVKAGNTVTRVLGTSFNIKAFQDDDRVTVALTEGKVQVLHSDPVKSGNEVMLDPGEGVTITQAGPRDTFIFDPDEHTAWKDGLLYFKKADFDTVIKALQRWYGVDFEIHNFQEDDWSFTGSFRNEYLSTVLDNLSYARTFQYEIDNEKVIMNFK